MFEEVSQYQLVVSSVKGQLPSQNERLLLVLFCRKEINFCDLIFFIVKFRVMSTKTWHSYILLLPCFLCNAASMLKHQSF